MGFWVAVVGAVLFTCFKFVIYWGMIKMSKGMGTSKRGRIKGDTFLFYQCQGGSLSFLPIKTYVTFCRLPCYFKYDDLDIRRILKYFLNIDSLTFSVCDHCEYPGLTPNYNVPFCFDRVVSLDFFGLGC